MAAAVLALTRAETLVCDKIVETLAPEREIVEPEGEEEVAVADRAEINAATELQILFTLHL